MALDVKTNYPWDGEVAISVTEAPAGEKALALRVPGWCKKWTLTVNGEAVDAQPQDGYVSIKRAWRAGDVVSLSLDMPVKYVRSSPKVRENAGRVALMRGPVVYCLEEADNGDQLHLVRAGGPLTAKAAWQPDLLGGIVAIETAGVREKAADWGETLYADCAAPEEEKATLKWIPYYAWANRGVGEMRVWIRE